jgi:hypothetical protein
VCLKIERTVHLFGSNQSRPSFSLSFRRSGETVGNRLHQLDGFKVLILEPDKRREPQNEAIARLDVLFGLALVAIPQVLIALQVADFGLGEQVCIMEIDRR